jgi:hypothetical protein
MKNRQFSKRSAQDVDQSGWTALPGDRQKAAAEVFFFETITKKRAL